MKRLPIHLLLALALLTLIMITLLAAVAAVNFLENRLTVREYAATVCREILPEALLANVPEKGVVYGLKWGIVRMEELNPPCWRGAITRRLRL